MALNGAVQGRLFNWKFDQAVYHLDGTETEYERNLVQALADTFGNAGYGLGGSMEHIVQAAVQVLIGPLDAEVVG